MLDDIDAAAFGTRPGRADLPPARTDHDRWLRAVALGGQGRYAAARAELQHLRAAADPDLRSQASSTYGSLLRQLGWHRLATRYDGRAAALAVGPGAACDALTGLAADALGAGRLALSQRLLERVEPDDWRTEIRRDWVRAELQLARGNAGAALDCAERAQSRKCPSLRHRIKSALLVAAARTAAGATDAPDRARAVLADASANQLIPLRWAAAMLLGDAEIAASSRAWIERSGGKFSG